MCRTGQLTKTVCQSCKVSVGPDSIGSSSSTKPTRIGASIRCCGSMACCAAAKAARLLSKRSSCKTDHAWVWAGQGWVLLERAGFSQRDNFVLGQARWHHDGWRWRRGHRVKEMLSDYGTKRIQTDTKPHIHASDICGGGGHDGYFKLREARSPWTTSEGAREPEDSDLGQTERRSLTSAVGSYCMLLRQVFNHTGKSFWYKN